MSLLKKIDVRAAVLPSSLRLPPLIDEVGIQPTRHIEVNGREVDMVDYYAPIFTIIEGSPWSVAGDVSNAILNTTFDFGNDATCDWASRSDPDRSRLLALGAWLESYLAGGGSPDYHTDATPEIRQALSAGRAMANDGSLAHQFSWANQEVKYLRGRYCH